MQPRRKTGLAVKFIGALAVLSCVIAVSSVMFLYYFATPDPAATYTRLRQQQREYHERNQQLRTEDP
ncbi:hypothetical protein DIPPA_15684 [Diplonema papillatum]|nr:hypothetical protein DIPPA_15684 [Diplonema papillatum]